MLLLGASQPADTKTSATLIFDTLGVPEREERESSHYAEGSYFLGLKGRVNVKVSSGDSDYDDRPLWIVFSGPEDEIASLFATAVSDLKRAGFRLSRFESFGKQDEIRVDL